jgi:ribosomal protein S18 acetylase RimI-like enzyme
VKPSPSVWIAAADEADAVTSLLVELRDWCGRPDPPSDPTLRGRVDALLGSDDLEFLLARAEDWAEPLGICQVRFRASVWSATCDAQIEDLFVRSHARGRGVGRALVETALERGRGRGCTQIDVDVGEANDAALRLYERAGFVSKAAGGRQLLLRRRLDSEDG